MISASDHRRLWAAAGYRCSMCETSLVKHVLGSADFAYGEMAHVIASSPDGPRGQHGGGPHGYENRILLCVDHHRVVDNAANSSVYTPTRLFEIKAAHERRVAEAGQAAGWPGTVPMAWRVPADRANHLTVGRDPLLDELAEAMTRNRIQVLHGPAGMGKTQVAVSYAARHAGHFDVIWWFAMDEFDALIGGWAELGRSLELDLGDPASREAAARAVIGWLERNGRWLLIFDAARDSEQIADWLPARGNGQVVVTSRNPAWGGLGQARELRSLGDEDGGAFLRQRIAVDTGDLTEASAEALSEALLGYPLALEQAAGYIEKTGSSLGAYRRAVGQLPAELLAAGPTPLAYRRTVARTWHLCLQLLRMEAPASAALVELCAFFAPADLPQDVLLSARAPSVLRLERAQAGEVRGGPPMRDARTALRLDELVGPAIALALIHRHGENISMHALGQEVMRAALPQPRILDMAASAARMLDERLPKEPADVRSWPGYRRLLSHIDAVVHHSAVHEVATRSRVHLVDRLATYFQRQGDYQQARSHFERALTDARARLGDYEPVTLSVEMNLGLLWRELDPHEAEARLSRTLGRVGSVRHRDKALIGLLADTQHNLGLVQIDTNRLGSAERRLRATLDAYREAMSPDDFASSLKVSHAHTNLGLLLWTAGRSAEEVEALWRKALDIAEEAVGEDNLDSARCRANLAVLSFDLWRTEEASQLHEQALGIRERVLGDRHPELLPSLTSLSHTLTRLIHESATADDRLTDRASELLERAEEIAGATEQTAALALAINNRGLLLAALGRREEGLALLCHAFSIRKELHGERDHGDLAQSQNNMGVFLRQLGDPWAAIDLHRQALAMAERLSSRAPHPQGVMAKRELAEDLTALGKKNEANELLQQVLDAELRQYGRCPRTDATARRLGEIQASLP